MALQQFSGLGTPFVEASFTIQPNATKNLLVGNAIPFFSAEGNEPRIRHRLSLRTRPSYP
jgi:hypothetical protein